VTRRRKVLLAVAATLAVASIGIAGNAWRRNAEIAQFKKDARRARVAVHSYFIDDCGGVPDYPGNPLSPGLTTPIAYMESLPRDRFSPTAEILRYVQTQGAGNGARFLIISRGPDRDWDIDRLRTRATCYRPIGVGTDVVAYRPEGALAWVDGRPYIYLNAGNTVKVAALKYADGREETVQTFESLSLGTKEDRYAPMTESSVQEKLARDGISIYDPTNGARSDGDLIVIDL